MPFFQYKAVNPAGEVQEGVLEAASAPGAVARIQEMGFIPIRAEEAGAAKAVAAPALAASRSSGATASPRTTSRSSRASWPRCCKAGLPLDRSFEILINLAATPRIAELLGKIRNDVRGGAALSKALDAQRGVFSRFYVNMIRAGEAGGSLPTVLLRLAEYMERSKALRDNVTASLTYPAFLAVISVLAVAFLLAGVVPRFKPIFASTGKAIPFITQVVLFAGDFAEELGRAAADRHRRRCCSSPRGACAIPRCAIGLDRWLVTAPIVGDLFARIEMARFSRTLGTLLTNGVTLVAALTIVRETMANAYLAEAIGTVARELKEGRGLGPPDDGDRALPDARGAHDPGRRGDRAPRRHADAGGRDLRPRGRGRHPQGAGAPAAGDDRR